MAAVQILAAKLDLPFVNFWLAGPIEPYATSLWRGSNRRAFTPNPLAYFPQMETGIQTQHMVSAAPFLFKPTPVNIVLLAPSLRRRVQHYLEGLPMLLTPSSVS